jgi:hypothetical protein
MAPRRRQLKIALITTVGVVSVCATLRFVWWATPMAPGQYQIGYFEEPNGLASLVLDDAQHTSVQPDVALDASGALSLPPGRSVGLPLEDGVEYRVRVDDQRWAPFCVFGHKEPVADQEVRHGGFRLADARALVPRDGRLSETTWTVVRPWRDDQRTLEALRQACGAGDETPLLVQVQDGRTDIQYGACSLRLAGSADTMAVLAGPAWTSVGKRPAWRTETHLQPSALLITAGFGALEFAIASMAIGAMAAGLLTGVLFALACVLPQTALVGLVAVVPLSFAVAGIRMIRTARRAQSRLSLALGILLVSAPVVVGLLPFAAARLSSGESTPHSPQRCLLIGYSTMRGDSLRQDANRGVWVEHGGLWDDVQQCGACNGSFDRRALAAGRFSWVRDVLCEGGERRVMPDGQVIFFGGSNDDFVSARFRMTQIVQAVRLARYAYARPDVAAFRRLAATAATDSMAALPSQVDALREALACTARDGARFRYVHDFFVWDLAEPRSAARQRMLDARAETVRRAGGDFVDLLHEVVDEAGVWWFNDYVHPSEIAHRRIGTLICRELEGR